MVWGQLLAAMLSQPPPSVMVCDTRYGRDVSPPSGKSSKSSRARSRSPLRSPVTGASSPSARHDAAKAEEFERELRRIDRELVADAQQRERQKLLHGPLSALAAAADVRADELEARSIEFQTRCFSHQPIN